MRGRSLLAAVAIGLSAAFGGFMAPAAWRGGFLKVKSATRRSGKGWTQAHAQRMARKKRTRQAQRRRGR